MAHSETLAWGKCAHCGGDVALKKNRSELLYYRCDHCGVSVQHHWMRSSNAALAGAGVKAEAAKPEAREEAEKEPARPAVPEKQRAKAGSLAYLLGE